jgi:hypothetical protein
VQPPKPSTSSTVMTETPTEGGGGLLMARASSAALVPSSLEPRSDREIRHLRTWEQVSWIAPDRVRRRGANQTKQVRLEL